MTAGHSVTFHGPLGIQACLHEALPGEEGLLSRSHRRMRAFTSTPSKPLIRMLGYYYCYYLFTLLAMKTRATATTANGTTIKAVLTPTKHLGLDQVGVLTHLTMRIYIQVVLSRVPPRSSTRRCRPPET